VIPLSRLDRFRIQPPRFWMGAGGLGDDICGCFDMKRNGSKLRILATVGDGWEHVSVSRMNCCPTWEEMSWVAQLLFGDEPAMQLHVASTDHVNHHKYCLHWWRPIDVQLPLPPWWMVGPKQKEAQA
jgi:hypothetical protein